MPARLPLFVLTLALAAGGARAECSATSGPERVHLVELYTSEGCSSCPPADRWLGDLPAHPQRIALAFHVDYWDSLGWADPYADARYSERQRDLAGQAGSGIVYTPEVTVDGREWRHWQGRVPEVAASSADVSLRLQVEATAPLRVSVASAAPATAGDYAVRVAVAEDGLTSSVQRGENAGRRLQHDRVVRSYSAPLPAGAAQATLALPADAQSARLHVVAFAQRRDGEILNALDLPLAGCALPAH